MRPITARDLMNPDVLTVRSSLSIDQLAAFLVENEISGAPVEDAGGKLVGVVSLVDVAGVRRGGGRPAGDRRASDRPDFYRRGWEDEEEIGRVAELQAEGDASDEDAGDEGAGDDAGALTVADVMTPALYTVSEEATVSEIAAAMLDGHLHRLLVTGASSTSVVGIITTSDLLGLLVEEPQR